VQGRVPCHPSGGGAWEHLLAGLGLGQLGAGPAGSHSWACGVRDGPGLLGCYCCLCGLKAGGHARQGEGGSVGLLQLAGPVQKEGEERECWARPRHEGREEREGNRFSNLSLNGFEFGFEKNSSHLEKDFQDEI